MYAYGFAIFTQNAHVGVISSFPAFSSRTKMIFFCGLSTSQPRVNHRTAVWRVWGVCVSFESFASHDWYVWLALHGSHDARRYEGVKYFWKVSELGEKWKFEKQPWFFVPFCSWFSYSPALISFVSDLWPFTHDLCMSSFVDTTGFIKALRTLVSSIVFTLKSLIWALVLLFLNIYGSLDLKKNRLILLEDDVPRSESTGLRNSWVWCNSGNSGIVVPFFHQKKLWGLVLFSHKPQLCMCKAPKKATWIKVERLKVWKFRNSKCQLFIGSLASQSRASGATSEALDSIDIYWSDLSTSMLTLFMSLGNMLTCGLTPAACGLL